MHRIDKVYKSGNSHYQIGDNTALIDFVYVGNVAKAHILAADKLNIPESGVAGEAFFITNNDPMKAFDFYKKLYQDLGADPNKKAVVIPRRLALFFAPIAELFGKVTSKPVDFTRFSIQFMTCTQTYNIGKVLLHA